MDLFEQGKSAYQRGDFGEARRLLECAGEDRRALLLLGQMASRGDGSAEDPKLAARIYQKAADLGDSTAAYNLGAMYATGHGVGRDDTAALNWYQRSGDLGDANSLRIVGLMYASGQGTSPDLEKAEQAWRAAVDRGQRDALADLGKLFAYHRHSPVQAAEWYLKSAGAGDDGAVSELLKLCRPLKELADSGDTRARTMLGVIFMMYVDAPAQTVQYLSQSAAEGDPVAQRTLAFLLERGQGVQPDRERAVLLYRSAAEAGDNIAAFNLGLHLANGAVVASDTAESIHWLRTAASSGVTEAYPLLGNQLSALDQDEEALHWYVAGAESGNADCMFVAATWYRDGIGTAASRVQALR